MMGFVSVTTVLAVYLCLALGQQMDNSGQQLVTPHFDCETNKFVCANNYSIPSSWLCDSQDDCPDGSDELLGNCVSVCNASSNSIALSVDCEQQTFTCDDGSPNPLSYLCDGFPDCYDDSDEMRENCAHNCPESTTAVRRRRKRWAFLPILKFAFNRAAATQDLIARRNRKNKNKNHNIM